MSSEGPTRQDSPVYVGHKRKRKVDKKLLKLELGGMLTSCELKSPGGTLIPNAPSPNDPYYDSLTPNSKLKYKAKIYEIGYPEEDCPETWVKNSSAETRNRQINTLVYYKSKSRNKPIESQENCNTELDEPMLKTPPFRK